MGKEGHIGVVTQTAKPIAKIDPNSVRNKASEGDSIQEKLLKRAPV